MVLWLQSQDPEKFDELDDIISSLDPADAADHSAEETERFITGDSRTIADLHARVMELGIPITMYLSCSPEQAMERLNSEAADKRKGHVGAQRVAYEDLIISFQNREVRRSNKIVRLSPHEYNLLELLAHHFGHTVATSELKVQVLGESASEHYLGVVVGRLRAKIGDSGRKPRYIFNETGVGYRFGRK